MVCREAVFLSAGGYHHHIALNTWQSAGGRPPAAGTTGLFHVALLYPDRRALANALKRLIAHAVPLEGASDHGVSEALYLRDRMAMASNCIAIVAPRNGHGLLMESWRWIHAGSMSPGCWPRPISQPQVVHRERTKP